MSAGAGAPYTLTREVAEDDDAYSVTGDGNAEVASFTVAGAAQTAAGADLPVRRHLAAAGPGSKYSDSTVLSIACGKGVIDGLLHDALGNVLLWDDELGGVLRVVCRLRPGVSTGTLWRRGPLSPWRVVILLVFLLPGPGHVLSPWGCVVIALGQGHGEAHPCTPQVCTEASLSLPLGGANVFSPRGRPHKVHHPRKVTVQTRATLEERT